MHALNHYASFLCFSYNEIWTVGGEVGETDR